MTRANTCQREAPRVRAAADTSGGRFSRAETSEISIMGIISCSRPRNTAPSVNSMGTGSGQSPAHRPRLLSMPSRPSSTIHE